MSEVQLTASLIKILVVFGAVLSSVAVLVIMERRVSAFIQFRYGPNRVGPFGFLQPVADLMKLMFKEDIIPAQAHRTLFILAPVMTMAPSFLMMAVIPFGDHVVVGGETVKLVIADVSMGVLFVLAVSSLGIYGLAIAGWSSGSKYSLLGGLRATAQMISYELTLGLAVVGVLLSVESFSIHEMITVQSDSLFHWNIFRQPLGFLLFLVAIFAETNRLPFDMPEAESELVSGYHTEYSSMKFAFFFMGEYAAMVAGASMITGLFLGGWDIPGIELLGLEGWGLALAGVAGFVVKVGLLLFFFIHVRWTLPRFRYDQLMRLGWKVFLPLALINVLVTGFLVAAGVL